MRRDAVRQEFSRRLRSQSVDGVFDYLDRQGYVGEVMNGGLSLDGLVAEGRRVLAAARPRRDDAAPAGDMATRTPSAGAERRWAVSQIAARIARDDREVCWFREKQLPDGLLAWPAVEGWIKRQAASAGPASVFVEFVLPAGHELADEGSNTRFEPPIGDVRGGIGTKAKMLSYLRPGDTWTRKIAIVAGSPLGALRSLSTGLSIAHAWTEAQATVFVLTGITPMIDSVRMTTGRAPIRDRVECGWGGRIVLNIDPTLAPDEVADAYREARERQGVAGIRKMSDRQAVLGGWTFDRPEKWRDLLTEWNRTFPNWTYVAESNFRRDALRAQRRLMYPGNDG